MDTGAVLNPPLSWLFVEHKEESECGRSVNLTQGEGFCVLSLLNGLVFSFSYGFTGKGPGLISSECVCFDQLPLSAVPQTIRNA